MEGKSATGTSHWLSRGDYDFYKLLFSCFFRVPLLSATRVRGIEATTMLG